MKKRSPLEANIANSKVQQNMSSSPISIAFMAGSGITTSASRLGLLGQLVQLEVTDWNSVEQIGEND